MSGLLAVGRALLVALVLTAVLGLAYPLLVTGVGLAAFHHQAQGSLLARDGRVVGSRLAAQPPAGPRYFFPRPSATTPAYNAAGTTFANLGPTNEKLVKALRERVSVILAREGPYNPGLAPGGIPVDAVTTSGSGIDPHISPAYAQLQARRVAAVRHVPLARIERLIAAATDGRSLGLFGEPGVNVLALDLALDRSLP